MTRENHDAGDILLMARNLEGKIHGAKLKAEQAIQDGWTAENYRIWALENLPSATPVGPSPTRDIPTRDLSQYSISRAMRSLASGKGFDGLEREVSDELATKSGMRAQGVWVPDQVLTRNAIAGTGTLGGMVVSTPNLGSEFIELLRSPVAAVNLGARVLSLANPVTIPKKSASATVNWTNGETAAATLSGVTFGQITLSPKIVSGYVQTSRQLLATSNPVIDQILQQDLIEGVALAIDKAVFHGSGSNGEPTGLANLSGVNNVTLAADGSALTTANAWPAMVSLESAIATSNGDFGALGYVMNAATRGKLKTLSKSGMDSQFVWDNTPKPVNSYNVAISNQLLTNETCGTATTLCTSAWMGAWDSCLIGEWGAGMSDILLDPYSASVNGILRIIIRKHVDIAFRRPEQFSRLVGILS